MPLSTNKTVSIDKKWIKNNLKHDRQLALSVLLAFWGVGLFLLGYLDYSVIGFLLLIICWGVSFILFMKLPPTFEKVNNVNYVVDDIESLKNSYEIDKKNLKIFKKISIYILILFDLIGILIASLIYFVYQSIFILDLILGISMLVTGLILYLWIIKRGKEELIRNFIK